MNQQYPNVQGPVFQGEPPVNGGGYYYHPYYQNGNFGIDPQWYRQEQEKLAHRKFLTKKANWIGAAMLFVQLFGTILVFLIPALVDALFPGASVNGGVFYEAMEYAIYSPISILVPFWIAAKVTRHSLFDLLPFEKHSKGLGAGCVLFAF